MLGPFIDTLIVCTLTALVILVTGVWETSADNGVTLTANAFNNALPSIGNYALLICIFIFSVSSLLSYSTMVQNACLLFLELIKNIIIITFT